MFKHPSSGIHTERHRASAPLVLVTLGHPLQAKTTVFTLSHSIPLSLLQNKKMGLNPSFCLAGAAGIEPALKVLETLVLPLYDAPKFYLITSL